MAPKGCRARKPGTTSTPKCDLQSLKKLLQVNEDESGEVSEWLKEHAWKVCIRQRIEGSNPSLSAKYSS